MPFLARRSVDPLTPATPLISQTPRTRARSEASLFRRMSTLFTVRRRTPPKSLSRKSTYSTGIEYNHTFPRASLPRVSSDSTLPSSLEIRRPSGLGRRASVLGSRDDYTTTVDSDSLGREVREGTETDSDSAPTRFASLPNLLNSGGTFRFPERLSCPHLAPPPQRRSIAPIPLPDAVFRVILEFLPQCDLPVVALVCRGFCAAARYALYRTLDVQTMKTSSLERLYSVLACKKELATLVVSFYCHSWSPPPPSQERASPDGRASCSVPSHDVRQALQNMYNLKSLTLPSFVFILSLTPSLTFTLTHLTILDKKLTQSQLVALRSWLATQASLESLSFPYLVEYTNTDPSFTDEWAPVADSLGTDGHGSLATLLPRLKSLRGPTELISMLCLARNKPIKQLTLDVHETLYTGLRPSSVIRTLKGVHEMHVVFAPEVDKRTVEKFLGVTGTLLTGEDKPEVMKSLEVEVSWTEEDAAETLYGIVTSIISRFRGLETLKLTSPFRSIQASMPMPPVLCSPRRRSILTLSSPRTASLSGPPSLDGATTPPEGGGMVRREFVACGIEKSYARTWTKHCPSLSDIQFDFSCGSMMDTDVELCGVWFRRKIPSSLSSAT